MVELFVVVLVPTVQAGSGAWARRGPLNTGAWLQSVTASSGSCAADHRQLAVMCAQFFVDLGLHCGAHCGAASRADLCSFLSGFVAVSLPRLVPISAQVEDCQRWGWLSNNPCVA